MDRRSGFDRRSATGILAALRSPSRFVLLLTGLNLFNVADYLCTLVALRAGIREANPIMARLFSVSPSVAGLVKIVVVGLISALLWRLRAFRVCILATVLAVVMLFALFGYHALGFTLSYLA